MHFYVSYLWCYTEAIRITKPFMERCICNLTCRHVRHNYKWSYIPGHKYRLVMYNVLCNVSAILYIVYYDTYTVSTCFCLVLFVVYSTEHYVIPRKGVCTIPRICTYSMHITACIVYNDMFLTKPGISSLTFHGVCTKHGDIMYTPFMFLCV